MPLNLTFYMGGGESNSNVHACTADICNIPNPKHF